MECPRKAEATMAVQLDHKTHWRPDGTCSYCGSISPQRLFEAIEAGCKLGPTDKNYKVYVDLPEPNPDEMRVCSVANTRPDWGSGWQQITEENRHLVEKDGWRSGKIGDWFLLTPRGPTIHAKFYFQHLSEGEMKRFVDLYNAKKLNIGYPGHFYTRPFFMVPAAAI